MNPFANPAMFEQMKRNMNPETMKNATSQMNNMSDEELKRLGQQSGMNISPEMMRMASGMFQNMDDQQMKNMMNMAGNMNPSQFQQQQQQFQQQQQSQSSQSTSQPKLTKNESTSAASKPAPQVVDNSLFPQINTLKNKGNERFKAQDWEGAATNYLEAIISIDEEKLKKLSGAQEKELRDSEINCRNNYCSVKAKQNDYHSLLIQAQAVLKLDANNMKAKFRLGQGFFGLKKYEKAMDYLTEAKNASPQDQIIADTYNKCKVELDKIKVDTIPKEPVQEEKTKKSANVSKGKEEETINSKEEKIINSKEEKPVVIQKEEVIIEEIKEKPKTSTVTPATNAQTNLSAPKIDPEALKRQQEVMKNMDDSQIDQMSQMIKNMDNSTLKSLYKAQGMDLTDQQITMMKQMTTSDTLKSVKNINPELIQQQSYSAPTIPSTANVNPDVVKSAQEKMKNMSEDDMKRMTETIKNMDSQTLKNMYKSQGLDMTDQQIEQMKSMVSPDIMKTAANTNPELIKAQQNASLQTSTTATVPVSTQPNVPFGVNNKEAIQKSQEQLKNMVNTINKLVKQDDSQISNMASMMKNMDNSFLKQMYKSQGMDLSDEQINMMKNMMTPEMIKTASSMNPNSIPTQQQQQAFSGQGQVQSNSSSSEPQVQAQAMPDMSNIEGMLENTQMIETAINMVIANPEMLKMLASQFGPNHPLGNYLQNSSPEDLRKLVNKLKYLIPVIKYGYKGFKIIKKFKTTIMVILIALVIKYFFL